MPPSAAGGAGTEEEEDGAVKASVASLMSLPAVQTLAGEEGTKRRAVVEKGLLSSVSMAEKMRTHKFVVRIYDGGGDGDNHCCKDDAAEEDPPPADFCFPPIYLRRIHTDLFSHHSIMMRLTLGTFALPTSG